MNIDNLQQILVKIKNQELSPEKALEKIKYLPYEDIDFAKIDHHRNILKGFPEVIFCEGKNPWQTAQIFQRLCQNNQQVLATRACPKTYEAVKNLCPNAIYHPLSRTIIKDEANKTSSLGNVLILSAGTSDLPIAEEAQITAKIMGNKVRLLSDLGVAGLHRLLAQVDNFNWANVIIVVAGMEGALPSVVAGLTDRPIIAVPTSIGYGSNFKGLSALLGMLNSCSFGISVVNIDNGFGAATMATSINKMLKNNLQFNF